MNSSQATLVVLLLVSICITSALVATAPGRTGPAPARCVASWTVDASVMSQLARAQASMALSHVPGAASVLPFSF